MAFTASHYLEVARIIREQIEHHQNFCGDGRSDFNSGARWAVKVVAGNLGEMFRRQNPKFDVERFNRDCTP